MRRSPSPLCVTSSRTKDPALSLELASEKLKRSSACSHHFTMMPEFLMEEKKQ